jgi:endonuclease/exonuclease/phosphatase family metal-dependent hydrolase
MESPQPAPVRLKVLSYNIHKGFSTFNRRFVLERMREVLEIVDADVVFLQEVLGEHRGHASRVETWPTVSQFEHLADKLWPHHCYGKNAVYSSGHHGNAILSKHGFVSWENIDISTHRLERRGLLHASIRVPGNPCDLHLICLHLDLHEYGRRKQIYDLADRMASHVPPDAPLVVAGDFNDWRHRAGRLVEERLGLVEAYKALHGNYARSFPSWMPLLRLDRIYLRGVEPVVSDALTGKPWSELSDHTPLFAELTLGASNGRSSTS